MSVRHHAGRNRTMLCHRQQSGFTLIEVLVAVVVFSIGLVGLGATMALSIRTTNVAAQRTQAVFLAESLANMMRANDRGVWAGAYNGGYPVGAGAATCDAGCDGAQLATRDQQVWSRMLERTLANGRANVACALNAASAPAFNVRRMPDGLCTITMTWSENVDAEGTATGVRDQSFAWVINP